MMRRLNIIRLVFGPLLRTSPVRSTAVVIAGLAFASPLRCQDDPGASTESNQLSDDLAGYVEELRQKKRRAAPPTSWGGMVRRGLRGTWDDYVESLKTFHREKCAIESFSWATGCGILMAAHRFKESGGCMIRTRNWGFATYFGMLTIMWFTCRRQQINTAVGIRKFYEDKDSGAIEEAQIAARERLQLALRGAAVGADSSLSGGTPGERARSLGRNAAPLSLQEEQQLAKARHEEEVSMWKRRRAQQQGASSGSASA